ncbi:MAG TPA: hypothetical protein VNX66_03965 [Candidatus Sulfotelmatobacter sp.]|nr:hypothetical protein [Candidatus Sulfotelmatobacter sp.]
MSDKENLTVMVWEHAPSRFSGTDLVLLLKLAGLSNNKDGCAFAGVERLAVMCGVTERALRYALRRLDKTKFLKTQKRVGHSNRYFLNVEELKKLPSIHGAEPTAEAVKLSVDLEESLRVNLNGTIPADWRTTWPVDLQKLFDAGHTDAQLRPIIKFARLHEWWSDELRKHGAHGLVSNFTTILEHYTKAQTKVAA